MFFMILQLWVDEVFIFESFYSVGLKVGSYMPTSRLPGLLSYKTKVTQVDMIWANDWEKSHK